MVLLNSLEMRKLKIPFDLQINKFYFSVFDDMYCKLVIWNAFGGILIKRENLGCLGTKCPQ